MKKVGKAFKGFFSSLWEDFVALIKHHWLRFVGFLCCFVVPIIVLLAFYCTKVENATKYSIPFAVIIPLVILIAIWWGKAKTYFKVKIEAMRVQNSMEAGKHAGLIIIYDIIKAIMTVLPFLLCYIMVNEIQKYFAEVSKIFLFITICEAVGGLFMILDTISNVVDYSDKEESNE